MFLPSNAFNSGNSIGKTQICCLERFKNSCNIIWLLFSSNLRQCNCTNSGRQNVNRLSTLIKRDKAAI